MDAEIQAGTMVCEASVTEALVSTEIYADIHTISPSDFAPGAGWVISLGGNSISSIPSPVLVAA
jgi:hypothetical protein